MPGTQKNSTSYWWMNEWVNEWMRELRHEQSPGAVKGCFFFKTRGRVLPHHFLIKPQRPVTRFGKLQWFPGGSVIKNLPANAGNESSIPRLGRSPGEGNGYPLRYSCLGNPTDRESWWATVHGVAKNQTWLHHWAHTQIGILYPES